MGQKQGKGVERMRDSATTKFEGDWREGILRKGIKTDIYMTYVGEFDDKYGALPHGQGRATWVSGPRTGHTYEGAWVRDSMEGQGTYTRPDGYVYVGAFKGNKQHGQGRSTFLNGQVWEGSWIEGEFQHPSPPPPPTAPSGSWCTVM